MPRFVLLRHETPPGYVRPLHWDLMLETGRELTVWALTEALSGGVVIAAEQLPPHRLAYLDYEGPVSGDRGMVSRVDTGEYRPRLQTLDRWEVELLGESLRGELVLERVEGQRWSVVFGASAV